MERQHANPPDPLMRLWQHRKWVAIGFFLLIFVPGMVFLWTLPRLYAATATLTIPGAGDNTVQTGDGLGFGIPLAAVSEQVLSRRNLSAIGAQMRLFPHGEGDQSDAQRASAMRQNVTVSTQDTKGSSARSHTYAFTVTYRDWQPQTAAAVANRLAKSYRSTAAEMQANLATRTADALAARIAEVGKKLDEQRARINEYQKKHLGGLPQQQQVLLAAISRLDAQLQSDQADELDAIRRHDELLGQTANSGGGSLAQLKQRLKNLRTTYTDQYPEVKQLKQQIAALESQKQQADPSAPDSYAPDALDQVNAQLRSLRENENATREKLDRYQKQLNMLPVTSQQLQDLSQGFNASSGVYSTLLKSYEHARVFAATMNTNRSPYHILEAATASGGPVGPKRMRFAIMLLILSVIIGVGAAYIAEKRDTTFHSLEELRDFTLVPVLATIPYIRDGKWHPWQTLRSKSTATMMVVVVFLLSVAAYAAAYGGQAITLALTHQGG